MVKMVSKQVIWAAEMWKRAFPHKAFPVNGKKMLHTRGCHYWIVSNPHLADRVPGVGGVLRDYEHTRQEYQNLSDLLVRARIAGLVDADTFFDKRNSPLIKGGPKEKFEIREYHYKVNSGCDFSVWSPDEMKDWDKFTEDIHVDPYYQISRFHNQMYEVIVITEKATVEAIIKQICLRYGANCLVVTGQASFTRVREAALIAKANKRPILLLGLYDLDPAGWDMGPSVMKRIRDVFPHKDHKFVRVCLMRDQANTLSLPISFDTSFKRYPPKQRDRFLRETGATGCYELDALDNTFIRRELAEALKQYINLKVDRFQNRRLKRREYKRLDKIYEAFDVESYKDEYCELYEKYEAFKEDAEEVIDGLKDDYNEIRAKLRDIEEHIKDELINEVETK